jgi:hypothetical protein
MATSTAESIAAIHAMMASGHRSVRIERHTLVLWGLAAAFLILAVNPIFTPERFPVVWQRSAVANLFIAAVLTGIGVWDFRLTRRARRMRDETLSFVQLQLTKVWWLLIGLIVAINVGMNFFGGGYMFYGLLLAIMGLAFYIHGLFSEQMLSWIGVLLIAMGLGSIALKLPFPLIEWLSVFVFGLGFPVLAFALNHAALHTTLARRSGLAALWLSLVIAPTAFAYQLDRYTATPAWPMVPLDRFLTQSPTEAEREQVVRLPSGTIIPLHIEVTSDVLEGINTVTLPMKLSRPMQVAIHQGKPDGRFRVDSSDWKKTMYNYRIQDINITSTLARETGPQVSLKLRISTDN